MGDREKNIVRRWFEEVWNQRRDATIDELLATDAAVMGLGEEDTGAPAPELFRKFHRKFCGMFPVFTVHIAQIVSEGEDVAARLECTGHHAGAPAAAEPVKFGAMVFTTVRDGKIVHGWNLVDEPAMTKGIAAATAAN